MMQQATSNPTAAASNAKRIQATYARAIGIAKSMFPTAPHDKVISAFAKAEDELQASNTYTENLVTSPAIDILRKEFPSKYQLDEQASRLAMKPETPKRKFFSKLMDAMRPTFKGKKSDPNPPDFSGEAAAEA